MDVPSLEDHGISPKLGCLLPSTVRRLPVQFEAWNQLGDDCASLFTEKKLRDRVSTLPALDERQLRSDGQRRLAYVQLSLAANAYVWENPEEPAKSLPSQLAVPLFNLAERFGTKPGVTYFGSFLCNYYLQSEAGPVSVENVLTLVPFPGGKDWDGILKVTNLIEGICAPGYHHVLDMYSAAADKDNGKLKAALQGLNEVILKVQTGMKEFHEHLQAETFFHKILPLFKGWGAADSPLPDGMKFEGVDTGLVCVTGASAAHTPSMQIFDAALGVTHEPDKATYHGVLRSHMYRGHREFIEKLRALPSVRDYALSTDLADTYRAVVTSLTNGRTYHVTLVTKYVVVPMRKAMNAPDGEQIPPEAGLLKHIQTYRDSTKKAAEK